MSINQAVNDIIKSLENPEGHEPLIMFYERARYLETESKEQGRPIYENAIYIRKHISKNSVYDGIAREDDFKKYPKQYEHFMQQKQQKAEGMPVGYLPGITPAEAQRCEVCRIYTVEQLAEANESVLLDIGNTALAKLAKQYLTGESAKDQEIEELKKQLEELKNVTTNDSPKRSGRNTTVRKTANSN